MMRTVHLFLLAGLLTSAGAAGCSPASTAERTSVTEAEVSAFMRDYGADLRAANLEAVIGRYDEAGVYMLGEGNKIFVPKDSLAAGLRARWKGPAFFEWMNLSVEIVGLSAAVVAGQFRWVDAGSKDTVRFSYTSLVRRTATGLRIRVEDESPETPAPK